MEVPAPLPLVAVSATSSFVSRSRLEQNLSVPPDRAADELRQINGRLERIEAALSGQDPGLPAR